MKKIFALICVISILLTFSACRKPITETSSFTYVEKGEEILINGTAGSNGNSNSQENNATGNDISADNDENIIDESVIELTEKELKYKPNSLTVTLYDSEKSIYGFTYNTTEKPIKAIVQIKKEGANSWSEYALSSKKTMCFDSEWKIYYHYVSKTEIKLDANSTYVYRVCDTGAEKKFGKYIGSKEVTFKTKNTTSNSFSFAHISDTQRGSEQFGLALSKITDKVDFLLHTGDVVQNPIESDWKDMIDNNFKYLSQVPMMAISGNHEVNGGFKNYDTYNHFNNNIPTQTSTASGYFYSFVYGNAKFIMLNTNDLSGNKLSNEQYDWLVNELQSNDSKWKIVSLHNPLYSVGEWGSTNNTVALALQEQLKGIFAQYKVDLVLQGHDHTISRTHALNENGLPENETFEIIDGIDYSKNPNGVIYLTNGTTGSVTREPENYDQTLFKYAAGSNMSTWSEISIDGDKLTVVVKHYDDGKETVYYKWGIKKS